MIENVWQQDAFSMFELSNSIMNLPTKPGRVLQLGVFAPKPIKTTVAVLENKNGVLELIPDTPRGTEGVIVAPKKREARAVPLMHLPESGSVMADDVTNVRAFGSTTELQQISSLVNDKLTDMKTNIEVTREHAAVTALQGAILDADGTTVIQDLFSLYGITRSEVDFVLGTGTTPVREKCMEVKRLIEDALGAHGYDQPRVLCSDSFFDAFTQHDNVKAAYDNWASNEWMRDDVRAGFPFGGCIWENYDPKVGVYRFITDGDGAAYPEGTQGVFNEFFGPADYQETVGTLGQMFYAKQDPKKFNKGTDLEAQSNPLPICVKPGVLVRVFSSN